MKGRICILANENPLDHSLWIKALENNKDVEFFDVIDLTSNTWLDKIQSKAYNLFLLRPPGRTSLFKQLYDERVYLISQHIKTPVFPSIKEVLIYENKRFLRDWLMINELPHPRTFVFFSQTEAKSFLSERKGFPIVGKTNIGASGNGVSILKEKKQALDYIETTFKYGIKPKMGPKISKGSMLAKLKKVILNKGFLKQRLKDYKVANIDYQYNFVIFQEFIPHDFEWRCVKIGQSFFAHKKIVKGSKASGTMMKEYCAVPINLLNFIRNISERHDFNAVAIDIFEHDEQYLINEIQCFFGQSDPYQMLVNEKPGRYVYKGNEWIFEEGMFNTNESYDIRLDTALKLIENND